MSDEISEVKKKGNDDEKRVDKKKKKKKGKKKWKGREEGDKTSLPYL